MVKQRVRVISVWKKWILWMMITYWDRLRWAYCSFHRDIAPSLGRLVSALQGILLSASDPTEISSTNHVKQANSGHCAPTQANISQKLRQKSQHGTIPGVVTRLMYAHYKNVLPSILQTVMVYCVCHPFRVHKNRQFLSTEMEFLKNVYAYLLKVPSYN